MPNSNTDPEQHIRATEEAHSAPLPDSLRRQLETFKKDLWKLKITEAILAGLLGLIVSFVLVFALDRIWEIPSIVRLIILIAGVSLFTVFTPFWINRWVFKHRKENQLARLIAKRYPNLGDRLLGVIELQDQQESQTALSPKLREAAMIAVAQDTKKQDLDQAVSASWRNKLALGFIVTFTLSAIAFFIFPNAGKNAMKRWFMPLSDTERYTFTKFNHDQIPNPLYVPLNEPFSLIIPLQSDTEKKPETAQAKYNRANWKSYPLDNSKYKLNFAGKRAKGTVYIKAGDANHNVEVIPIKRPKIKTIQGFITYPKYLNRAPISEDFIAGQLDVLQGSLLTISATAERELEKATVGPLLVEQLTDIKDIEEAEIQGLEIVTEPKITEQKITHSIRGSSILPAAIEIKKSNLTLPLTWTDKYGIAGLTATKLNINPIEDSAPTTYIQNAKKQIYILHTDILSFTLQAEDDYGIKQAGIEWTPSFSAQSVTKPAQGRERFVIGDPYKVITTEDIEFDFKSRNISPQKLEFRTWVEDYNPATKPVYSDVMEVFLLSESEHANYQKDRMKDTLTELEEAMRREQENLDENKHIERDLKDPNKTEAAKDKLENQRLKEQENKDEVKELAKKMEDIFKESIKNKNITPKTLKNMSDAAQQMQEMAEQDMLEIAKKLADAQSDKNSTEKSTKDVKEAIKKQEELLKKMKQTAKNTDEANKQLESETFVNRLKQAAANEETIASLISPQDGIISGDFYADLDPARQRVMQNLYRKQLQTTNDMRWIKEDLSFFYSRTQKEIHKKILTEMEQKKISESLKGIENLIEKTRTYLTIQETSLAAKQLREWAKMLDGDDNQTNSGGGGSGGGGNQEDQDFEFMLRVMKMIQKEQQIRAKTRALEQSRRNATGITPEIPRSPQQPNLNQTP